MATLDTARVREKGEQGLTVMATFASADIAPEPHELEPSDQPPVQFAFDLHFGIGSQSEIGFRFTNGIFQGAFKRQVVDAGPFALSLSGGLGTDFVSLIIDEINDDEEDELSYAELFGTVIASVELGRFAALYVSGRAQAWFWDDQGGTLIAASTGVRIGGDMGILVEATRLQAVQNSRSGYQLGIAFYIDKQMEEESEEELTPAE